MSMRRMRTGVCLLLLAATVGLTSGCRPGFLDASPFAADAGKLDSGRINLWPIFYKSGNSFSFLWPLITKTDDSFAIRPLFDVWADGKAVDILFPLGRLNRHTGNNWLFPFFWNARKNKGYFHLFPLGGYDSPSGFSWLFPFFWNRGEGYFHIFPLVWSSWTGDKYFVLFPLYIGTSYYKSVLWPLLQWGEESGRWRFTSFPFFRWRNDGYSWILWPLYHRWDGGKKNMIFPLYLGTSRYKSVLWPLLQWRKESGRWRFTSFPFFRWRDNGYSWVLWPLYHRWDSGNQHMIFPLVYWGPSSVMTPLFGWGDGWMYALGPLLVHSRDRDGQSWWTPLVGWRRGKKRSWLNILGPLFFAERYASRGRDTKEHTDGFFLWPLGWFHSSPREKSFRLWPIMSWKWTKREFKDGPHKVAETRSQFHLLWFLYRYDRERRWDKPTKEYQDRIRARILWKLFDYRRVGHEVSVDMFPFVTYDRDGVKTKQFSFLWRFFSYERVGYRKKLYLLFIRVARWGKANKVKVTAILPAFDRPTRFGMAGP